MGGWEVQPAWLGDDDGGDVDPPDQPENLPAPGEGDTGDNVAKPRETET